MPTPWPCPKVGTIIVGTCCAAFFEKAGMTEGVGVTAAEMGTASDGIGGTSDTDAEFTIATPVLPEPDSGEVYAQAVGIKRASPGGDGSDAVKFDCTVAMVRALRFETKPPMWGCRDPF